MRSLVSVGRCWVGNCCLITNDLIFDENKEAILVGDEALSDFRRNRTSHLVENEALYCGK